MNFASCEANRVVSYGGNIVPECTSDGKDQNNMKNIKKILQ